MVNEDIFHCELHQEPRKPFHEESTAGLGTEQSLCEVHEEKKIQTFCKWQKRTLYIYLLSTYSRSLHTSTSSTTTSSTMRCYYRKISVQYRVSYAYEQDKYTGQKQATTELNLCVIIDKNALMVTQVNRKYRKYYGIIGMGKSRRGNN